MQKLFRKLEQGDIISCFKMLTTFVLYSPAKITIQIDSKEHKSYLANVVTISNGSLTGPNVKLAPAAKLNDHHLTVSVFTMSKLELLRYFFQAIHKGNPYAPKVTRFSGKKIVISSSKALTIHADSRVFKKTPAEFHIIPHAFSVIAGASVNPL
jgi:diacylglycerol kinase family enzyme